MRVGEHVRTDTGWEVVDEAPVDEHIVTIGSNFMVGNGYLGYRGTRPDQRASDFVGCVVSDTYDMADSVWRELCTVPNGLFVALAVDDEPLTMDPRRPAEVELTLQTGEHTHRSTWTTASGATATVSVRRFASLDDLHLVMQHVTVVAHEAMSVTVTSGIDSDVWSLNGDHFASTHDRHDMKSGMDTGIVTTMSTTGESKVEVAVASSTILSSTIASSGPTAAASVIGRDDVVKLAVNESLTITTAMTVASSNDDQLCTDGHLRTDGHLSTKKDLCIKDDPPISEHSAIGDANDARGAADPAGRSERSSLQPIVTARLAIAMGDGYRSSLERSARRWAAFWDRADVEIDGDPAAQAALRFSIWHNRIATPAHTDHLPIGARGLSCQAYQGAAFWDQEMFNLPAYLVTTPEIARNILVYRWRTLDGARRKARRLGYAGAYYAWISGTTGDELCPDFFFDDVLTGRPIRNHFNVWQMHVSPDIAHAVMSYWDATGDDRFMLDHGAEIVFEVATFLHSFVKFDERKDRYEVSRLLGPDEWHENVDNDAYTNRLSQLALRAALDVHSWLAATHPARWRELSSELGVDDARVAAWQRVHDKLYVPEPDQATGIIEQFDGFSDLEDTRPDIVRTRVLDPGEYWGWPNGVAVHTQVSKQPAVVQLFTVDGDYPLDVQRANYDHYEPRCAHGSSLSHSVHATVAARLAALDRRYLDQAYDYFMRTATLDLTASHDATVGGTFIGGMHTAANAGTYQTAVFGFGGLTLADGVVSIDPHLPSAWSALRFKVIVRGRGLAVEATPTAVTVRADGANDGPIDVSVAGGDVIAVQPGATSICR